MKPAHTFTNARRLSPLELAHEAEISLENRDRYCRQSAATRDNAPAPLPPAAPLPETQH